MNMPEPSAKGRAAGFVGTKIYLSQHNDASCQICKLPIKAGWPALFDSPQYKHGYVCMKCSRENGFIDK